MRLTTYGVNIGVIILFINMICMPLYSQENNYWWVQQGTVAELSGGAVIPNSNNQTAAYYNPGLLPFVKSNSVSLNANTYFLKNIVLKMELGMHLIWRI